MSPTTPTDVDSQAPANGTGSTSPLTALSGTLLDGRYALGEALGAGGMGAVFEAQDQLLDRPVAIKVIRPGYAERIDYIKRFLREAQAASKVRHRNVVVSLDYGEAEGGLVYSVMELLVGQDLKQLLKQSPNGRLPWSQARALLIQITSGLKAAHDQGVIHRDIKPANCFVTEEDDQPVVKLVDFGIAKVDDSSDAEQITRTSQVLGTPSYIAPELVRTKGATSPRSDVYSLGVMAYRMLTGGLPFIGETAFEVMYRACTESVPRMRPQVPDLPAGAEQLVLEMLAKDPQRRPVDMAVVRQRLQALPEEIRGRRNKRGLLILGAGAVAAVLGLTWAWSAMSGADEASNGPRRDLASQAGTPQPISAHQVPTEHVEPLPGSDGAANEDETPATKPKSARPAEDLASEVTTNESITNEPSASAPITNDPSASEPIEESTDAPIASRPAADSQTDAASKPKRTKRQRATNKPKRPPSDETIKKRLRRKIKAKCGELMQGDPVTVLFTVTESGAIEKPTSMPKNAAGECAIQQVRSASIPPRDKKILIKVFVE